jgi:hypothetical protein
MSDRPRKRRVHEPIVWLKTPIPLWPGRSRVMISGGTAQSLAALAAIDDRPPVVGRTTAH